MEESHAIEAGNAWSDKNSPRSFPRPNSDQITFCFDSIVLQKHEKDSRIGGSLELYYSSVTSFAVQWERPPAAGRRGSTALVLKVGRLKTCLGVFS